MRARDIISDAAAACQSVVIHGDTYSLTDYVIAALRAAGFEIVPRIAPVTETTPRTGATSIVEET